MPQTSILVIKSGPQKGNSFLLEIDNTLGRGPDNSMQFTDPRVSRHHCHIWKNDSTYRIKDLDSKNGTYLNNLPITETILQNGDIIQIGETKLNFLFRKEKQVSNVSLDSSDAKQTIILSKLPANSIRNLDADLLSRLATEKMVKDLSVLYHLSFSIYTIRNIDRLLNRVLELIFKAVPVERGVILLVDKQSQELTPQSTKQRNKDSKEMIKISTTMTQQVYLENIAILTKDASIDKRFDAKTSIIAEKIRSAICVPIGTPEETFGAIYLDTKTTTYAFTEDTLRLITAIANQVAIAVENIQFHNELELTTTVLHKELREVYNMIGTSKQMKEVFNTISKVAPLDSTVLITGESGTGKELVARAIHYNSKRTDKPFICVNCTTLPEALIESELFGHEKGAFTGAHATKPGQFELCNGGTIFLDEIAEMPIASQSKLLRVLEENKIRRVGGTKDIPVDIRVIAASNRNIDDALKERHLREDLFYRLKVINIHMSPLRERKGDIPLIIQYYLEKFKGKATHPIKGFSTEAVKLMESFSWPGNVRELKNCIERAIVLSKREILGPKDLDLIPQDAVFDKNKVIPPLDEIEKKHIHKVLETCKGNKTKAAELLGIRRSTLYEKLKLYKINEE